MNFARFFRRVQDAPWYAHFLNPVFDKLAALPVRAKVLDVGTGAGKLIEMGQKKLDLNWVGADTDEAMLTQARKRPSLRDVPLELLTADAPLPFPDQSFDAITFCSVLFLLPDPQPLLNETMRILRPGGLLIVLTPTGEGNISPALLRRIGLSPANSTFFLWRSRTADSGQSWLRKETLKTFALEHEAEYQREFVFNDLALVELISRASI